MFEMIDLNRQMTYFYKNKWITNMGHHITAIITNNKFDTSIAKKYDLPFFEENGYYIIALDVCHSDSWAENLHIVNDSNNDIILDSVLTHYFCNELKLNKYAIIETDYFSGVGSQIANVYNNGKKLITNVSINKALKELGVVADNGKDEFDTLNLSNYRQFEDYFEKYWDE